MATYFEKRNAASIAKGYPSYYFERKAHEAAKEFSGSFSKVFHGKTVKEVEREGNGGLISQFGKIWRERDLNGIPERGSGDHAAFEMQLSDFYEDYVDDYPDDDPPDVYDEFWSGPES